MAAIAIRKSVWDAAAVGKKFLFRAAMTKVGLGDPAVFSDGIRDQYIWHDSRLRPRDIENLAALAANINLFPEIVPNRSYVYPDDADVFVEAAKAQSAPAWFKAAESVPDGWFPVDTGV